MNGTGTSLALRAAEETNFTATQIDLIRNTAAKGCNDEEIAQLLIIAHRTGLDPLAKQIYMIKRYDGRTKREVATPQASIDGYRLIADRTERYAPGREPAFAYDDEGNLWAATAYVKKLAGGTWHEVASTALYREYVQTTRDGNPTMTWLKMPHVMLSKCAEALALRRAFPAELSGLYTAEEMAQADSDSITVEVQPVAPAQEDDALIEARKEYNALARRAPLRLAVSHPRSRSPRSQAGIRTDARQRDALRSSVARGRRRPVPRFARVPEAGRA